MRIWFTSESDPDAPPRRLWTGQDDDALQRRMGYADVAAFGSLRVVTQCSQYNSPSQLTLALRPYEVLHGSLEEDLGSSGEITLQIDRSSLGFERALQIQRQLPGTRYLLFLKREPVRDKEQRFHWAFYRPTRRLMAEVRTRYRALARRSAAR
jgi:hypothetical protein